MPPLVKFIARRAWHSLIVIFIVLTVVFVLVNLIGDPVKLMVSIDATPGRVELLRKELGLDRPLGVRYWDFLTGAVRGDFGDSLWMRQPVMEIALDRLPSTLLLGGTAMTISALIGLPLGFAAATTRHEWLNNAVAATSFGLISVVEFWAALVLIYLFAVKLGVLPTSGFDKPSALVLPALVVAMRPTGRLAQFTAVGLRSELQRPYARAAIARGLERRRVTRIHALKNAAVPTLTVFGNELIQAISAIAITETVFAWPGLGSLMVQAISNRDVPLVTGCVFLFALVVVVVNTIIDLTYGLLDRRARIA